MAAIAWSIETNAWNIPTDAWNIEIIAWNVATDACYMAADAWNIAADNCDIYVYFCCMKNYSGWNILGAIIICNIVCAGLLLVNNSSTWDSLLLTNAYDFHNNEAMKNCIFNTGRRIEYFIALLIFHFPCWLMLLKALSFMLLVGIQFFLFG